MCWFDAGEAGPGDKMCVPRPVSAGLHPRPYTAAQTGRKSAGCPSGESEKERRKTSSETVTLVRKLILGFSQIYPRFLFSRMTFTFQACAVCPLV